MSETCFRSSPRRLFYWISATVVAPALMATAPIACVEEAATEEYEARSADVGNLSVRLRVLTPLHTPSRVRSTQLVLQSPEGEAVLRPKDPTGLEQNGEIVFEFVGDVDPANYTGIDFRIASLQTRDGGKWSKNRIRPGFRHLEPNASISVSECGHAFAEVVWDLRRLERDGEVRPWGQISDKGIVGECEPEEDLLDEHASPPPFHAHWPQLPTADSIWVSDTGQLTFAARNSSPDARTASLRLFAETDEGRFELDSVLCDGEPREDLDCAPSSTRLGETIDLRALLDGSEQTSARLFAELSYEVAPGVTMTSHAPTVFFHRDPDDSSIVAYREEALRSTFDGGRVGPGAHQLGRRHPGVPILKVPGQKRDVEPALLATNGAPPPPPNSMNSLLGDPQLYEGWDDFIGGNFQTSTNRICLLAQTLVEDAAGGRFGSSTIWPLLGARYEVYIPALDTLYEGYASALDGCVALPSDFVPGSEAYEVTLFNEFRIASSPTRVAQCSDLESNCVQTYVWDLVDELYAPGEPIQTVSVAKEQDASVEFLHFDAFDPGAAGAVATINASFSRWLHLLPDGWDLTDANDIAVRYSYLTAGSASNPTANTSPTNAGYIAIGTEEFGLRKFISGHEAGHTVQTWRDWDSGGDYAVTLEEQPGVPCRSDSGYGHFAHALRSLEEEGAALREGEAHFFSWVSWNALDDDAFVQPSDEFFYYKTGAPGPDADADPLDIYEFDMFAMASSSQTVQQPTAGTFPFRYRNEVCDCGGMACDTVATELDALRFMWGYLQGRGNSRDGVIGMMNAMDAAHPSIGSAVADDEMLDYLIENLPGDPDFLHETLIYPNGLEQ